MMMMIRRLLLLISVPLAGRIKARFIALVTGAKIAPGVSIGFGTLVSCRELSIGGDTRIGMLTILRGERFDIGAHCHIGHFSKVHVRELEMRSRSKIGARVEIAGDWRNKSSRLTMGMHSQIFQYCFVNVSREVTLGRNAGVGGGSYLFTHGSWLSQLEGYPVAFAPIVVEDDVWLPWGCFLMPGVRVGRGSVVGARSVITRDVPPNALVAGVPAKVIRDRASRDVTAEERVEMLASITREFAEYHETPIEEVRDSTTLQFRSNGVPVVVIHYELPPSSSGVSTAGLHLIVQGEPGAATFEVGQVLDLATQRCSSWERMDRRSREWLDFASGYGIRFYPVDES